MLYPKDPPEAESVPLGRLILDVLSTMLGLLWNMKRKLMFGESFIPFVCTAKNVMMEARPFLFLRNLHAEIIKVRSCLVF